MDTNAKSNFTEEQLIAFKEKWMREEQIRKEKVSNMLETDNYINWLDTFTKKYSNFSDDLWLYYPHKISEEDNVNVRDLRFLYEIVSDYAEINFYTAYKCEFGSFYIVKIGEVFYEIGIEYGQGARFYCSRLKENNKVSIDFEDIRNNVEQPCVKKYNAKLDGLKSHITKLKECGIPASYIKGFIKQILKNL